MKLTAKGRVSFPVSFILDLLDIPEDFRTAVVTYDKGAEVITLIGYSENSIDGLTYSFKEADRMEDVHFDNPEKVRDEICQKRHEK